MAAAADKAPPAADAAVQTAAGLEAAAGLGGLSLALAMRGDLARVAKAVAERDTVRACLYWGYQDFDDDGGSPRGKRRVVGGVSGLEPINVFRAHEDAYRVKGAPREAVPTRRRCSL